MHKLHEFKGGLVLFLKPDTKDNRKFDNYRHQSVVNPVPEKWEWQYRKSRGNLMNTTVGAVVVINPFGREVRRKKFSNRPKRNEIVQDLMEEFKGRGRYLIYVEFEE